MTYTQFCKQTLNSEWCSTYPEGSVDNPHKSKATQLFSLTSESEDSYYSNKRNPPKTYKLLLIAKLVLKIRK